MKTLGRLFLHAVLALLVLAPGLAHALPENGWWWNSAESGRGFFIEIAGTQVYMAGYFYEGDGRATWLVSQGQTTTSTTYQGRLLAFAGGQTLYGDYQPPGPAADVGAVSLQFTDDRHGVLTWPGGAVAIERQGFGAGPAALQPLTGWWWNDAESGRGYSVEVQGDQLFLVGFMYDEAGQPLWYFAAGKLATATHFEGQLLQFASGQTLTGAYRPPGTPAVVGTAEVDFTAPDEATLTLTEPATAASDGTTAKKGRSKIIVIKPQLPRVPPLQLPEAWEGTVSQNVHVRFDTGAGIVDSSTIVSGTVTWVQDLFLGSVADYVLLGSVKINYNYSLTSAAVNCTSEGPKEPFQLAATDGTLLVNSDGTYTGSINRSIAYPATVTCVTVPHQGVPSQTVITTVDNVADLVVTMKGNVVYLRIQGEPKPLTPAPGTTVATKWNFGAK